MWETCGRHLWCAAIALDLYNKVSHLTFQNQPCPLQNTSYFTNAGASQCTSANTEHLRASKGFCSAEFCLDVSWNSTGISFHLVYSRSFQSLGLWFSFCSAFTYFFFHQNLKLPPKMSPQVTVSGRQFHGSTSVWSISQIMAMTGFFKLQWWE